MRSLALCALLSAGCSGGGEPASTAPASADASGITLLETAPPDALVLQVDAVRWRCKVSDPSGAVFDNLTIPAGRAIKLAISTREAPGGDDGIEISFVGPKKRVSVRAGKPAELVFRADNPGTYKWRCPTIIPPRSDTEPGVTYPADWEEQWNPVKPFTVVTPAEYEELARKNNPTLPENKLALGKGLYERKGCASCHAIDGSTRVGPSWKGIWGTTVTLADGSQRVVDEAYVKASIKTPSAFGRPGFPIGTMPSFEGALRDHEIDALIEFIKSLKTP